MPFDDVDVFRTITDQEVIHIERTFNTRRDGLNDRVNFQTKKSNREIVCRVRGKIIRSVLCNIVCNNCAQCNAHTYQQI